MEVVGAYRMFERSNVRMYSTMNTTEMGTQRGYESVKNFYGINTVTKLECIGHVQKRVGAVRQLKKNDKERFGEENKLTDKLIDRIQNYYGIAIRNNVVIYKGVMSSVIAAFFHCVSGKNNSLHGQCPEGSEVGVVTRAKAAGVPSRGVKSGTSTIKKYKPNKAYTSKTV
ncbi:uncharacterized protein LOC101238613 [Trichonephila clavipes]|nr:uncharacterized protein LOC101238613 [Trichonephila clavipes]